MTTFDAIQRLLYRSLIKQRALTSAGKPALIKGVNGEFSFIGIFVKKYKPNFEFKLINELIEDGCLEPIEGMTKEQMFDFYLRVGRIHTINEIDTWDCELSQLAADFGEMS